MTNQADYIVPRHDTVGLVEGKPLPVRDFADLESAQQFCRQLLIAAPYFKCRIYHGSEVVHAEAGVAWRQRELPRLRAAHSAARRRRVLYAGVVLGLGAVGLGLFVPALADYRKPVSVSFIALMIMLETIPHAFTPRVPIERSGDLAEPRRSRATRALGIAGFLIGAGLLASAAASAITPVKGR